MGVSVKFYSVYVSDTDAFLLECSSLGSGEISIESMRKLPAASLKTLALSYPVYLTIPSYGVFTRVVDLVAPEDDIVPLAVQYELQKSVPMPLHMIKSSYSVMSELNEAVKRGVISAVKYDALNRYSELHIGKGSRIGGYTYGLIDFYNAMAHYADRHGLRSQQDIVLGLFTGKNYVDLVILGREPNEDLFKTIHRSNYVSAILDVKELLEAYFSKHGGVAGAVALTKGITQCVFLGYSFESSREISEIINREFGLTPIPLSIFELVDSPPENLKDCGFVMAFGQALAVSKSNGAMHNVFVLNNASHRGNPDIKTVDLGVGFLSVALVLVSSLSLILGPFPKIMAQKKQLQSIIEEQKKLSSSIRRYARQTGDLSEKIRNRAYYLSKKKFFIEVLSIIAEILPDKVKITDYSAKILFAQTGEPVLNITINGVGASYQDINAFVQGLRNKGIFKKVTPVASRLLDGNEKVEVLISLEL